MGGGGQQGGARPGGGMPPRTGGPSPANFGAMFSGTGGTGQPRPAPAGGGGPPPQAPAWGQRFQAQFGAPPGQMKDEFQAFKQGGVPGAPPGGAPPSNPAGPPMPGGPADTPGLDPRQKIMAMLRALGIGNPDAMGMGA